MYLGIEGYLVSPAVFKTVEGGVPALVSSILTCPRQNARALTERGHSFPKNLVVKGPPRRRFYLLRGGFAYQITLLPGG